MRIRINPVLGYALAMKVLQSKLYSQLDELETAECNELIRQGLAELREEFHVTSKAAHDISKIWRSIDRSNSLSNR